MNRRFAMELEVGAGFEQRELIAARAPLGKRESLRLRAHPCDAHRDGRRNALSDKFFSSNRRVPVITTQLLPAALLYLTFEANPMTMFVGFQTLAGIFLMAFSQRSGRCQ